MLDDPVGAPPGRRVERAGHKVDPDTVAGLLHSEGFSLQANAKMLEGNQSPDRDAQFAYLNRQAAAHLEAGDAVISVDAKKKELVGEYKNAGAEWRPAGDRLRDSTVPVVKKDC